MKQWSWTTLIGSVCLSFGLGCDSPADCPLPDPGWIHEIPIADCVTPTSGRLSNREFRTFTRGLASQESVLTIGELDGSDDYVLGKIEDVDVDTQGNFVIADTRRVDVRLYSSSGQFLQTVGTAGKGPGEFRYPDLVAFDDEGVLYVSDRSFRVQRFRRAEVGYEYLDQFRLEMVINDLCIMRDTLYIQGRRLGRAQTDSIIHKLSLTGDHLASFGRVYADPSEVMVENYSHGNIACIEPLNAIVFVPYQVPAEIRVYRATGELQWITTFPHIRELLIEPSGRQTIPEAGFHMLASLSHVRGEYLLVQLATWTREQRARTGVPVTLESYVVAARSGLGRFLGDSLPTMWSHGAVILHVTHDPFPMLSVHR